MAHRTVKERHDNDNTTSYRDAQGCSLLKNSPLRSLVNCKSQASLLKHSLRTGKRGLQRLTMVTEENVESSSLNGRKPGQPAGGQLIANRLLFEKRPATAGVGPAGCFLLGTGRNAKRACYDRWVDIAARPGLRAGVLLQHVHRAVIVDVAAGRP